MALYTVYSSRVTKHYQSTLFSSGSVFNITCVVLTLILPLMLGIATHGFWTKTKFHREKPQVHFKHKALLLLETDSDKTVIWTNLPQVNKFIDLLRNPSISSYEVDSDHDGKYDSLELSIEVPLEPGEKIFTVSLYLIFQYKLQEVSDLQMESLGAIHYPSGLPLETLNFIGDLKFEQKRPLQFSRWDYRYDVAIFPKSSENLVDLAEVFKKYTLREYSTTLDSLFTLPRASSTAISSFSMNVTVNYPSVLVEYSPGLWEVLKIAWIQYLSFYIVLKCIVKRARKFIFEGHIVPTWHDKTDKLHAE